MKKLTLICIIVLLAVSLETNGQWNTSGNDIYNTNSGYVGIGNSAPATLLHVGKFMGEPTITIHNQGAGGGATFSMLDDLSGANWKFKATTNGGFKIRDHTNSVDVILIEPNTFGNALYISGSSKLGIGTLTPVAKVDIRESNVDEGVVIQLGTADLSHRMMLFGGRLNDPNPFINWSDGDPLRFSTNASGWSEKMRITSSGQLAVGT